MEMVDTPFDNSPTRERDDPSRVGTGDGSPIGKTVEITRQLSPAELLRSEMSGAKTIASIDAPSLAPPRVVRDLVGTVLGGKYELLRLVNRGGFGAVYEARDRALDARVAVKVIEPQQGMGQDGIEEFIEEARRIGRLNHPNIVDWKVFDQDPDGVMYFVMELIQGRDLGDVLREEERLPPKRVARILLQILEALESAHNLSPTEAVLHLDLKPTNIFLVPGPHGQEDEKVKVLDFGIGQYITKDSLTTAPYGPVRLSRSCTPEYASPEQCGHFISDVEPVALDERSDLYSLGMLGFLLLTGKLPFDPPHHRRDYIQIHRQVQPRSVRSLGVRVPRRLARFLDRSLLKDRDERWRDTRQALKELRRIVHPSPLRLVMGTSAGLCVIGVTVVWVLWPSSSSPLLDLFTSIDGVERSLADETLYLGPQRRRVHLRVVGLDPLEHPVSVRLLADRHHDAEELSGYSLTLDSPSSVGLCSMNPAVRRTLAFLEFNFGGEHYRYSNALEIVYVDTGSWRLISAGIPDLNARRLDPSGSRLVVALDDPSSAIASVVTQHRGKQVEWLLHASEVTSETKFYELSAEAIDLIEGYNRIPIEVTDLAGTWTRATVDLDVVQAPLLVQDLLLDAVLKDGVYCPGVGQKLRLHARLNRKASLAWRVVDDAGSEFAQGSCGSRIAFDIELPAIDEMRGGLPCSGAIELLFDERDHVFHRDTRRGQIVEQLRVAVGSSESAIVAQLETAESKIDLRPGKIHYLGAVGSQLTMTTRIPQPAEITVDSIPAGAVGAGALHLRIDPSQSATVQAPLHWPHDGPGSLIVTLFATAEDGSPLRAREQQVFRVFVDTAPPILIAEPTVVPVLRHRDEGRPALSLCADDGGPSLLGSADDFSVRISSRRMGDHPAITMERLDSIAAGASTIVSLPLPWDDSNLPVVGSVDGEYEARVIVTDRAGNDSEALVTNYVLATEGPEIIVASPGPEAVWHAAESGAFDVELLLRDPNGISAVQGTLESLAHPDLRESLKFDRAQSQGAYSRWRSSVRLLSNWSDSPVRLSLLASDSSGADSGLAVIRDLGPIDSSLPPAVQSTHSGIPIGRMRLVRGNRRSSYVFGGRSDQEEQRAYADLNLGRFNSMAVPRCWQVTYPAGAIEDYYLDEAEVTNGNYLAFVEDPQGWFMLSNWPPGAVPDEARRTELQRSLSLSDLTKPVIQISWEEAAAFAEWAGKRLPSLAEWEYALRGGDRYRLTASQHRVWSTLDTRTIGPTSSEVSQDVTEENGLRDLTANVSEWTATPVLLGETEIRHGAMPDHVLHWQNCFLSSSTCPMANQAEKYWVAGASFLSARADFSMVDLRRRQWRSNEVGFRCAVLGSELMARIEAARVNSSNHWEVAHLMEGSK